MKKKVLAVCMVMVLGTAMAACGQKESQETVETSTEIAVEVSVEESVADVDTENVSEAPTDNNAEAAPETIAEPESQPAQEPVSETTGEAAEEANHNEAAEGNQNKAAGGYEDNFAVDAAAAEDFANQIKDAVASQNLEALADLTHYPVYVGFADESATPASREEFIALGADRIFTSELMESVANADISSFKPSMAGFVVATGDGPNIIFGVVEGALAITGYNY